MVGRFANRWSEEHRATVVGAVLDDELSLQETLRRAKAGDLGGLAAFDMPRSTARSYLKQERERRGPQQPTDGLSAHGLLQRMLSVCDQELRKLEAATTPDITALERLAKVVAQVQKQGGRAPDSDSDAAPTKPTRTGQVESMLDAMKQRESGTTQSDLHALAEEWNRAPTLSRKDYLADARATGEDTAAELAHAAGHA